MKENYLSVVISSLVLMASFTLMLTLSSEQAEAFGGSESSFIETATAILFITSCLIFFYLFYISKTNGNRYFLRNQRNWFFLIIGLVFLVFFGEEISWGQRLLNFRTPDWLKEINNQKEINFHNINFIEASSDKEGLARWLTAGRIFTLFWFFYCLIIPILNKYSITVHEIIMKINFPVVPIWLGLFFLINYRAPRKTTFS